MGWVFHPDLIPVNVIAPWACQKVAMDTLRTPLSVLCIVLLLLAGCSSTKTVTDNVEGAATELELKTGDTIRLVTRQRERMFLEITHVGEEGLRGRTLDWEKSRTMPGVEVFVAYSDLALVQEERFSKARTAGAVATVTIVGALVAAVAVGPAPVMIPPP